MRCLVVAFIFVVSAYAHTSAVLGNVPKIDVRIVGGVGTTIEDVPYQASLQSNGKHICGGSIITTTTVLTAAHCTNGKSASSLSVRVGSTYRGRGGTVVNVTSICAHPFFNGITGDNDVSVLRLANNLIFSNKIQPIALLPLGSTVAVGTLATASGWGRTSLHSSLSMELLEVDIPKVSQQHCRAAYLNNHTITDSMTCYGWYNGGEGSCIGHSGGPLAIGRILVGVASWGEDCAQPGKPAVYADIAQGIIQNHINSCL